MSINTATRALGAVHFGEVHRLILQQIGAACRWSSSRSTVEAGGFWESVKRDAEKSESYKRAKAGDGPGYRNFNPQAAASSSPSSEAGPAAGAGDDSWANSLVFDMTEPMHLSPRKAATVSVFQDTVLIDLRCYVKNQYNGGPQHTKKGISLTVDQWDRLKAAAPEIDRQVEQMRWSLVKNLAPPADDDDGDGADGDGDDGSSDGGSRDGDSRDGDSSGGRGSSGSDGGGESLRRGGEHNIGVVRP
ncbi:unnamed protein product [Phaeothamnion confervicola]